MSTEGPLVDASNIRRGVQFGVVVVIGEYPDHEWHERYLCKLPSDTSDESILLAVAARTPRLTRGAKLVVTAYGKRLKKDNVYIWTCCKKIKHGEAKQLADLKLMPYLDLSEIKS